MRPHSTVQQDLVGSSVSSFIAQAFAKQFSISEIAGDASSRRFFRVRSGSRTAVLILHPEPLAADAPIYSNYRILKQIGAPVPRVIGSDNSLGCVLVQDFGDSTLQQTMIGASTGRSQVSHKYHHAMSARRRAASSDITGLCKSLYVQACDLIVLLHRKAPRATRPGDFASRNALDRERFLFEMDHFHRHFVVGLMGGQPESADEALLRAFYADLSDRCDALPRVYCHRDFQSRNLMVRKGGRLGLIDYQDARMGPHTYDAASLLRDSSLDLEEGFVEELLDYLARKLEAGPEEFRADFDLMALQRNIKDLGTFGYLATVRGRREYLDYVPRTLRSIRRTLSRSRLYHYFFPVLERHVLAGSREVRSP